MCYFTGVSKHMYITRLSIKNFRGISEASILLGRNTVFVGDSNIGKSTVLEMIDLILGAERISRGSPIDEHDFYGGRYLDSNGQPVRIEGELVALSLTPEQQRHFQAHLEFWDGISGQLITEGPLGPNVNEALQSRFCRVLRSRRRRFQGQTFFCWPPREDGERTPFRTGDKRKCGFLYLRTLRTGSRALSLERGSLLDVILRVRELRPRMWEQVLEQLRVLEVAEDPTLGLTAVFTSIQAAIVNSYQPIGERTPNSWFRT